MKEHQGGGVRDGVKTTDEFQEVSNDCEIVFEVLTVFASRESVELKGAMTKSAS